ncbi:large ribosomal subunit protein mL58 [Trichomonascus vanleenenianus]|uniref:mitochondrial 54S ribosomal protein mL58 MRPL20 n=1 Tax=Trichomonascus vanleenenianus TaxID=2268995 RepID=UPI003ECB3496
MWKNRPLTFVRHASGKARSEIPTRFPTKFNPVRSAYNPKIQLPKGLVHNPAPAAPSPYYTPAAFLPKSDNRKVVYGAEKYPVEDIPSLRTPQDKEYNLTEEDMIKIQELRQSDPEKWTRKALAKEFNCSEFFISIASKPSPERQKEMDRRLDVIKSLWTETRIRTRRERHRRRQQALRDAY